MEQSNIFEPAYAMLILTLLVWIYMYAKRIPFINNSDFGSEKLTPLELQKSSPPDVANPSDNLKNLFEIPTLFYFISIYLFVTNQVDQIYLIASWCFFAFRAFHSIVHCTFNAIILRFSLYVVSTMIFWVIVFRIIIHNIG